MLMSDLLRPYLQIMASDSADLADKAVANALTEFEERQIAHLRKRIEKLLDQKEAIIARRDQRKLERAGFSATADAAGSDRGAAVGTSSSQPAPATRCPGRASVPTCGRKRPSRSGGAKPGRC